MSKNEDIGFAIVGTGGIAAIYLDAIRQVPGADLRAVYNRSLKKAEEFVLDSSVEVEVSFDALLERDDIDVVCVTTPSGAHSEVAIPAMEAGKHVLCEKPLEVTVEKVDQIIETAEITGCILAVVFQSRFSPEARLLKEAINMGRFGRLTLCSAYIKWWRDDAYYSSADWRGTWKLDGGGALMNQGIHYVDLLQWLVGMPESVFAYCATLSHDDVEVEDTAVVSMRYPGGALGVIESSTSSYPGFERRIEIVGDKGSVVLEDNRIESWHFSEEFPEDERIRLDDPKVDISGGTSDPRAISTEGHRLQIMDLVDAIREKRAPTISGSEGRKAVQVVQAVYESAWKGEAVEL
ncbi:MAG: Myo-inositol 2-dehydrogenase [Candidatus Moanabacter tarae]|uniref:Myo-inositol 2-dehydrogenase n=1 Tax=Candidatus Moanibacter tarae TaxID=2200854 RepID=A0A2Z4AD76_9BACT|nr:MAG: Myo-inositol 2-dehydrogenase [Candidatus Moanabacter tarae]|tara:strand:- start:6876 stop:7925 length:1050 start_codon:yes stop_codon:yes gene_type:complete